MSSDFFEVLTISELFESCIVNQGSLKDSEKFPQWVSRLLDRKDFDPKLILSIRGELRYAATFFWGVVTRTLNGAGRVDGKNQESDADFFARCLSNHIYSLEEIFEDGVIVLEPIEFLIGKMEDHVGEPFHPTMLLIAYALWSLDKAISGLLKGDILKSTHGATISGSALMEAFRWQLSTSDGLAMMNTIVQRERAKERHANGPKQAAKEKVREFWEEWQLDRKLYKGKAAFSRAMLEKHSALESQKVIEDWCRAWEKERHGDFYKSAAE
ncbi:hypothetical protein [Burkholderia diffusa]|uniref:hypothetical protein n=1 Tax=Burkholderia diffusa TaxID=488732 RepID=UPI002ABDFB99|nr:hypothetical protein [Burkholderia diffusa]